MSDPFAGLVKLLGPLTDADRRSLACRCKQPATTVFVCSSDHFDEWNLHQVCDSEECAQDRRTRLRNIREAAKTGWHHITHVYC